jgi:tocopherol cyclase
MTWLSRLDERFRRSGANLPFGDPRPSHGAEMEGYFWRVTDVTAGRVLVVLCGVNRHPDGAWATVAVAAHPGGFVRSAVVPAAVARTDRFEVRAGEGTLEASESTVRVDLGEGARAELLVEHPVLWPRALGGGGIFSVVPFLGQYWQPHLLGGRVRGTARIGDETWTLDGADVYAEKNWGAGFPERWWWGQAHGFDRPDVCVAFSGGVLTAGPLSLTVGGLVVRVGAHTVRLTPPLSSVRSSADGRRWEVRARGHGYRVRLEGEGSGDAHLLPVPLPAERRNVDTDLEFLAGRLEVEVAGRLEFRGTTELAGLEIGWRPDAAGGSGVEGLRR